KRLDHQRKCRRRLAAAGVVEVVARERWTPVGENADKPTARSVRLNMSLREVGKAKALERSVEEKACAVEHELPVDAHIELSSVLLELPRVEAAAVGGQAKIETIVLRQILRGLGSLAIGEVGRRGHDGHPEIGADAHGDHVLGDKL